MRRLMVCAVLLIFLAMSATTFGADAATVVAAMNDPAAVCRYLQSLRSGIAPDVARCHTTFDSVRGLDDLQKEVKLLEVVGGCGQLGGLRNLVSGLEVAVAKMPNFKCEGITK